jgi:hypothetical protein
LRFHFPNQAYHATRTIPIGSPGQRVGDLHARSGVPVLPWDREPFELFDPDFHLDPDFVRADERHQVCVGRNRGAEIDLLFLDDGVEWRVDVTPGQIQLGFQQGGLSRFLGRLSGRQLRFAQHQLAVVVGDGLAQKLVLLFGNRLVALLDLQVFDGLAHVVLSLPNEDFIIPMVHGHELLASVDDAARDDVV